ncbi:MAG TPA: LLM class flavin-dependent oxidoreductase [Methylomirabilota bacterium]|jgi:alkanesulfonate monooxygenase SsuD/methylene tetrahydromethanopterin reductase-like flavin-dependent oxidoreductase (luciferase family)|nr:LLM class flavin-dependent oxidoreductase [Methylomirabilota bacterium]
MLKIGVRLSPRFEDAGEYLAEARALDAAGIAAIWLDGEGHDPWMLLSSLAAVTGRARLVVPVTAAEGRAPAVLERRLTTLTRLSRGRVTAGLGPDVAGSDVERLLAIGRQCDCPVIVPVRDTPHACAAGCVADALLSLHDTPEQLGPARTAVQQRREQAGRKEPLEWWVRATIPADAGAWWRTIRPAFAIAGATGLLVPADPRLLDLLRNGDEEDDRSDLQLAQG